LRATWRDRLRTVVALVDAELRVSGPATSNFVPTPASPARPRNLEAHRAVLEAEDLDALDRQPVRPARDRRRLSAPASFDSRDVARAERQPWVARRTSSSSAAASGRGPS
jgi:hypothetical protein